MERTAIGATEKQAMQMGSLPLSRMIAVGIAPSTFNRDLSEEVMDGASMQACVVGEV